LILTFGSLHLWALKKLIKITIIIIIAFNPWDLYYQGYFKKYKKTKKEIII